LLIPSLGAAALAQEPSLLKMPDTQLEPVEWNQLEGWPQDDHLASFKSFLLSCRPLARGKNGADASPLQEPLRDICRKALRARPRDGGEARAFFEHNFRPIHIAKLGESAGFLTGYYEPVVEGSRVATEEYNVPVYRRPWNVVASGRSQQSSAKGFPNKGKVGRLVGRRKIVPFYDRGEIEDGALAGRGLEICWLKSRTDLLFIQIQGSARVHLQDGTLLRLNYDGHNGWPYTPVGRFLIEKGIIPRDEMSMERIREWMQANPDDAKEVRRKNQSYVFFREVGLDEQTEAVGGQGVPLTPGRSIAVDRPFHAYGTLFFIDAELPLQSARDKSKFQHLMVAQDTGSAIVGPARADIYFGAGLEPGRIAGRIRHAAQFAVLVPKELDPVRTGAMLPLPRPKAALVEAELIEGTIPLPRPRPDQPELRSKKSQHQ